MRKFTVDVTQTVEVTLDALKLCQAALATMIAPATEAECKARAALSKAEPT